MVEQGSFTAAAELLDLPKSSVSRGVSRLETRLQTRLLQRSTRRINLTEIGRRYYDYCRRILLELEEANGIVESYRSQPSGLIRITAPYILGQAFLGAIVAEFLATYPRVQCQVELSKKCLQNVLRDR
ncbi:MAG: LysR family transcriptional regulator [Spirulina sp.]